MLGLAGGGCRASASAARVADAGGGRCRRGRWLGSPPCRRGRCRCLRLSRPCRRRCRRRRRLSSRRRHRRAAHPFHVAVEAGQRGGCHGDRAALSAVVVERLNPAYEALTQLVRRELIVRHLIPVVDILARFQRPGLRGFGRASSCRTPFDRRHRRSRGRGPRWRWLHDWRGLSGQNAAVAPILCCRPQEHAGSTGSPITC